VLRPDSLAFARCRIQTVERAVMALRKEAVTRKKDIRLFRALSPS
jgi:hypothetical protein